MCFYFLDPILPWAAKAILIPLFVAGIGLYYVYHARFGHSKTMRFMSNLLGVLLIAASVFISAKAYFLWQYRQGNVETFWTITNYETALQEAQKSHKPLFIDIGAPYCIICKTIDKTLFSDKHVQVALKVNTIPAKIDGSEPINAEIMKQFNVIGFPTVLLINPETQQIIKKWGPELNEMKGHEFVAQLNDALK
jgi:thiol:disulfide interchange protein